jgi:hypothetical protein
MNLWQRKLLACLHEPPHKPFRCALPLGVPRSRGRAEKVRKIGAQLVKRCFGTSADVWMAAQRGGTYEYQFHDNTRIIRDSPLTR